MKKIILVMAVIALLSLGWIAQAGGLVAHYDFHDGSGTTLTDVSGNGHNGLITGATWVTNALHFDGYNAYVNPGTTSDLGITGDMSFTALVNFNTTTPLVDKNYTLFSNLDWGNNSGQCLRIEGVSKILRYISKTSPAGAYSIIEVSNAMVNGNSYHIGFVREGGTVKIYVNGELAVSESTVLPGSNNLPLYISTYSASYNQAFAGDMKDVQFYNCALTDDQIKSMYDNQGYEALPSDPRGYVAIGKYHTSGIDIYQVNGGYIRQTINTQSPVSGISFAPNGDMYYTYLSLLGVYKAEYLGNGIWGNEILYATLPNVPDPIPAGMAWDYYGANNLAAKSDGTVFVGTYASDEIYKIDPDLTVTKIVGDGLTGQLGWWDIDISPDGVGGDLWAARQYTGLKNYNADGTDAGFNFETGYDHIRCVAIANGKLYSRGNSDTTFYEYNPDNPNSGTPYIVFTNFNPSNREFIQSAAYGADANGDGYSDFYFSKFTYLLPSAEAVNRSIDVYSGAPGLTPTTRYLTTITNSEIGYMAIDTFPKQNQSAQPTGTLTGTVNLLNFDGDKTTVPITVELIGASYSIFSLNLNAEGKFTIIDVPNGNYNVRIKASHWLAKSISGVYLQYGNKVMDPVDLINGDVVENNEVDFSDINAVRAAYGSFPGDDTWNERADVDGSGEVDFFDINIVRGKYGEAGDGNGEVAPCEMIYIPSDSFLMGNNGSEGFSYSNELPQHWVSLSGYWIGKYEVTRGEYRQFMDAGGYSNSSYWSAAGWSWKVSNNRTEPYYWAETQNWGTGTFMQTENHPVVGVRYYEAEAFCNWAGGHLPTEAQWEMAARWTGTYANVFPWGDVWDAEKCNNYYDHNSAGGGYTRYQSAPVGSYSSYPSPSGCQDMAGNVWEWCQDWYKSYPGSTSPLDYTNTDRVLRGGGWYDSPGNGDRCAYRSYSRPFTGNHDIGFRLARSLRAEAVSAPGTPSGNTSPVVNVSETYSTTGSTCTWNHPIEYKFNWGDGTSSTWSNSLSASHSWNTPGVKTVTVTALCQVNQSLLTASAELQVNVMPVEAVSVPGTPSGNASPIVNVSETYTTSGSTCNWGHTVEYSFNWGDGTSTPWSTSPSASHSWSVPDAKIVTVSSRCQVNTSILATSAELTVNVVGSTQRVSISSTGVQGNGYSEDPSISSDGRFVAFGSYASNLVSGDTNGTQDVFVHDIQTGETKRVSVSSDGVQGNSTSVNPSISVDGRFVAFASPASNLVTGDTNNAWDVFVHNRQTGFTQCVSISSDGVKGNNTSFISSISTDGRFVAYDSDSNNLVSGDTNGMYDVFVHDRQTGTTQRISISSDGEQGNQHSAELSISADGRFIAFMSDASNLVPSDTNNATDIFVHDMQTGTTQRISISSDGGQANVGSVRSFISADGRFVMYDCGANNLVSGDTNGCWDVFVYDRQNGNTQRISKSSDGVQGNYRSWGASMSANGMFITFNSDASNLVSSDTNGTCDIFVHYIDF